MEKDETQGDAIIEVFMAWKYGKIKMNAKYFISTSLLFSFFYYLPLSHSH